MNHFLKVAPGQYVNVNGIAAVDGGCPNPQIVQITYGGGAKVRLSGKKAERFTNYMDSIAQDLTQETQE
ncbi:MAG: hypothetical protein H6658_02250 [Ardenticatenaceae bacterium]|nr:hypothetical protein [Ardenticatenaceae bacterium]